jgi:hypothetical protein
VKARDKIKKESTPDVVGETRKRRWEREGKQCLGYMLKSCSKFVMWHSANFAEES